jgi:hypothetical protein
LLGVGHLDGEFNLTSSNELDGRQLLLRNPLSVKQFLFEKLKKNAPVLDFMLEQLIKIFEKILVEKQVNILLFENTYPFIGVFIQL